MDARFQPLQLERPERMGDQRRHRFAAKTKAPLVGTEQETHFAPPMAEIQRTEIHAADGVTATPYGPIEELAVRHGGKLAGDDFRSRGGAGDRGPVPEFHRRFVAQNGEKRRRVAQLERGEAQPFGFAGSWADHARTAAKAQKTVRRPAAFAP